MITELDVANIRLFEGENWKFKLPPLSVFCGTNSSGKSTLLKIIPLLKQSTESRSSIKDEGKLRYCGSLVDMGNYNSLVSHRNNKLNLTISITTEMAVRSGLYNQLLSANKSTKSDEPKSKSSSQIKCTINARFVFGIHIVPSAAHDSEQSGDVAKLLRGNFSINHNEDELLKWSVRFEPHSLKDSIFDEQNYRISLPRSYFESVGGDSFIVAEPPISKKPVQNIEFTVTLNAIIPRFIIAKRKRQPSTSSAAAKSQKTAELYGIFPLPPLIEDACRAIESSLAIHYIAPLRAPAKRYSVVHTTNDGSLDPAGEFLPVFLKHEKTQREEVLNVRIGQTLATREPLIDAVNFWLGYLRSGEIEEKKKCSEIEITTTKDILVEFKVRSIDGNEFHSMADSGFGYSQVLPIIVRGLLMKAGGTLIIEQPELHLNPALQVRLASFFVSLIQARKQLIIETHSEHIVNALRVLAAEDRLSDLSKQCAIYFIDTKNGQPIIHPMSIQENGTVPDWPRNFFGEALNLSGRLLRAQKNRS